MNFNFHKSWHSHIENIKTHKNSPKNSLIGQIKAREAALIIVDLVKKNLIRGRVILFSGPIGSGKTALALGIAQELGEKIPFCMINGSEIFSPTSKKTSLLYEKCRKAVGLRLFENHEFYEGEIADIDFCFSREINCFPCPFIIVFLKTTEGSLKLKLLDSLYEKFISKELKKGDIIRIEPNNKSIRRLGKSLNFFTGQIEEESRYLTTPTGRVFKKKSTVKEMTLYDLDFLNFHNTEKKGQVKVEKTDQLYNEVNLLVSNYIRDKKAEIINGILFIDEAHFLDRESFGYLSKILDSPFPPIVILATNRTTFFKSIFPSNLIFPIGFLSRCLTVKTRKYDQKEISSIVSLKSRENKNFLSGNCFLELCKIAENNSLRFSILLANFSHSIIFLTSQKTLDIQSIKLISFFFFHLKESRKLFDCLNPTLKVFRTF